MSRRSRSASPPRPRPIDEAAAAALAATADDSPPQAERATTRVMVTGLVSVASIATFKRSLGRVPGVSTIGVASGPDGEFVFTVSHDAGIGLGDAVVALPGFEARVTSGNLRQPRGHRARPRRRLLSPPSIPKESHVARPAIVVGLPPSESTTVSAELLAAGFEVIEIEDRVSSRRPSTLGATSPWPSSMARSTPPRPRTITPF